MQLAGGSGANRPAIRECEFLFVAGGARGFPIDRDASVVEEIPAQLDFGRGHRVTGWFVRLREALRQIPRVLLS
jgi:hypothetical protein